MGLLQGFFRWDVKRQLNQLKPSARAKTYISIALVVEREKGCKIYYAECQKFFQDASRMQGTDFNLKLKLKLESDQYMCK